MVRDQNPATFFALAVGEEAVGGIGVSPGRDVHRLTAELGYWLGEPFWGREIMTESVIKFTDYAFREFGLVRIFAEPYAENHGSCRVLEKAGFELEGRLKSGVIKNGRIMDQLMYAKVR
jgi:[ribosomal protein S5]-alanine N-acetyltransferase